MPVTNIHLGRPRVRAWTFSLADEESEWPDAWIPWKIYLEWTDTDFRSRCATNAADAPKFTISTLSASPINSNMR